MWTRGYRLRRRYTVAGNSNGIRALRVAHKAQIAANATACSTLVCSAQEPHPQHLEIENKHGRAVLVQELLVV